MGGLDIMASALSVSVTKSKLCNNNSPLACSSGENYPQTVRYHCCSLTFVVSSLHETYTCTNVSNGTRISVCSS
jgi:hypothetical protein